VSEIVFAFDGDRAGRAAAWRALQNVLPEAQDGREIRFLFLPEGEDPDTLVGKEGREAFEARIAGALPLPEFVVTQLSAGGSCEQRWSRTIRGPRPLLASPPVPPRALLERLAQQARMPAGRLAGVEGTAGGASAPPARRFAARSRRPASAVDPGHHAAVAPPESGACRQCRIPAGRARALPSCANC
jgi:DNA primase